MARRKSSTPFQIGDMVASADSVHRKFDSLRVCWWNHTPASSDGVTLLASR